MLRDENRVSHKVEVVRKAVNWLPETPARPSKNWDPPLPGSLLELSIQDTVASLTIFQRSPHWAAPFEQFRRPVPESVRFLLREVPLYQSWYRMRLGWTFNDRIHPALQKDPDWAHPER